MVERKMRPTTFVGTPAALIDPPSELYSSLDEWLQYRDDLRQSGIPGIAPFIREADVVIARLRAAKRKVDLAGRKK